MSPDAARASAGPWRAVRAAMARHRELGLAAVFAAMAGWELVEFVALEAPHGPVGLLTLVLHSMQVLLVAGITALAVRAWRERTRQEDAVARMVEAVVVAQEEERRRIAFDVHDGVSQLIVSAKQHVDTARDVAGADPPRAARELARAAERLDSAITETRRVLQALRPSAVDAVGLAEAMRRAVDDAAREAGWAARFVDELGDARVPAAVETAAFRILQEGLLNASRHARSRRVEVAVRRRPGWLSLEVEDDGVGLATDAGGSEPRGLGLAGMRERARLLGGSCRIESPREGGTRISVLLPLGAEHAAGG
jgi:signal transduction histidine kinase